MPVAVGIQLAQELDRQDLFAGRALLAGAPQGVPEERLGVGQATLQPGDVAARDPHRRQAQRVRQLLVDLLGLDVALLGPLPLAALLVDHAQVEQGVGRRGEPAQAPEGLERGAQAGRRGVPLAQVLEDEPQVAPGAGGTPLVPETPVEPEGLLVEVPGLVQIPLAVGHPAEVVERARGEVVIARGVRERERSGGVLAGIVEPAQPEERLGALHVDPGADGNGIDAVFRRQQLAAVGQRPEGITLGQPARHRPALERGPAGRRERLGGRQGEQALDRLQRGDVAVRLHVQVGQHLELGQRSPRDAPGGHTRFAG